jgi:hypothetical protein
MAALQQRRPRSGLSLLEAVLRYELRNEIGPVLKRGQSARGEIGSRCADLLVDQLSGLG